MKNGMVFTSQGTPDKDNSLVYIWDGLKRVVVRDSKIEKIVPDNAYRTGRFQLDHLVAPPDRCPRSHQRAVGLNDSAALIPLSRLESTRLSMEQAIIEIVAHHTVSRVTVSARRAGHQPGPHPVDVVAGTVERKNASGVSEWSGS
jgi:hypothetical protein